MKSHIQLSEKQMLPRVITCGSPERAKWIASHLKDSRPLAANREYHSFCGSHNGTELLVLSHGVGAAGAGIAWREAMDLGMKAVVRLGTAGALIDEAGIGDVVVAQSAIRGEGLSRLMVPLEVPAVPNFGLAAALELHVQKRVSSATRPCKAFSGMIHTSDLFYPEVLPSDLEMAKRCGALAVEMECSALFVLASLHNVKAASVLVLDGNPLKWQEGVYDPSPDRLKASMEIAAHAALDALVACQL